MSPTFLRCTNFEIHIRGLGSPVPLHILKVLCFSGGKTISIVKFDEEISTIGRFLRFSPLEMSIINLFVPSQDFIFPTFFLMLKNTKHVFFGFPLMFLSVFGAFGLVSYFLMALGREDPVSFVIMVDLYHRINPVQVSSQTVKNCLRTDRSTHFHVFVRL